MGFGTSKQVMYLEKLHFIAAVFAARSRASCPQVYNGPYGPESNMWHTAEGSMYAAELGDAHYEEGLFWMEW